MVVGTGDDSGVDRRWSAGDRGSQTAALLAAVTVVLSRASRAEPSGPLLVARHAEQPSQASGDRRSITRCGEPSIRGSPTAVDGRQSACRDDTERHRTVLRCERSAVYPIADKTALSCAGLQC